MSTQKVTKAVIAAAGRGTRFLPTVKAYAKELVPIINKPNIQYLVEEAITAGITELCIVHRHGEKSIRHYFKADPDWNNYLKSVNKIETLDSLNKILKNLKTLKFIPQHLHLPYGNASPLLAAKSFIGSDPFVFMFGDDLIVEKETGRYLKKMISSFEKYSPAIVASVKNVGSQEIVRYGSAKYIKDSKYPHRISGMYEKLPADKAPSFFGQGGRFVVDSKKLWPVLTVQGLSRDNELWFADAVNTLAANDIVITEATDNESDWMTTGDPLRWLKANIAVAMLDNQIAPEIKEFIKNLNGHNPFAWRIMGVIFAAMAIVMVYLLATRMFESPRAGLIAAFLLTFDCMHFAQARIATPDTYLFFFFAGMVYFFYRYWENPVRGGKYLFLSLVFFGLGFSTKWFIMYGLFGLMILLVILKIRERKVKLSDVLWFIGGGVTAVSIYMLSYLPYFIAPLEHGSLSDWWNVQWAMFTFHANLTATHPASSPWYTWPIMVTPVWFYVGYFQTTRAYIASFGNPALWWATIPAILSIVPIFFTWIGKSARIDVKAVTDSIARRSGLSRCEDDSEHNSSVMSRKLASIAIKIINMTAMALDALWHEMGSRHRAIVFIIIPFLTQWLLFIPIGRVVFLYHFYPPLIFVILAVTLWANWLWRRFKWGKWVVGIYLVLNSICFIILFPAMSGLVRSNAYWDSMKWLVNWII